MPMFPLKSRKVVTAVQWFDGPVWSGGAGLTVYQYDDGSLRTVESDWFGRPIVAYDGEPREVPEGTTLPPAPEGYDPRKGERARALPPVSRPPPWPPRESAPARKGG